MLIEKDGIRMPLPTSWKNISNPTFEMMQGLGWNEYIPPEVPPAPIVVSPRQIRQALTLSGIRNIVENGVAASSQDTKDWWEFATQFEENHPEILSMCIALNITEEQRHSVFTLAEGL